MPIILIKLLYLQIITTLKSVAQHYKLGENIMILIDDIKRGNRGTSIVTVTINDDPYVIGFLTDAPLTDDSYRTAINTVIRQFCGKDCADLYEDLVHHLTGIGLEAPLYVMPNRDSERIRIGKRIKALREELKLDARDIASVTGIDPSNLSRIEQGKYCAGIDLICKIATALGTKVDFVSENRSAIPHLNSMQKRAWIVPFSEQDLQIGICICAFGGCYLPQFNSFEIGDYVFLANMYDGRVSNISCLFIVSDVNVHNENVNPNQDIYWLNKEAQQQARSHNSYVFLKYQGPMHFPNGDIFEDLVAKEFLYKVPDTVIPIDDDCFNYLIQGAPESILKSLRARSKSKSDKRKIKLPNQLSKMISEKNEAIMMSDKLEDQTNIEH